MMGWGGWGTGPNYFRYLHCLPANRALDRWDCGGIGPSLGRVFECLHAGPIFGPLAKEGNSPARELRSGGGGFAL